MIKLSIISLMFVISANEVMACWAAPPPIVWHKPKGKPYHFSVTREGKVTVTEAKDHEKVLWSTKLTKYSGIFSKVYVVEGGKRIVHVKGNHGIRKITDCVVVSITKDGKSISFDISEFIDNLQPGSKGKYKISTDPLYRWLSNVKKVDKDGITLVNALGKEKSVNWKGEKKAAEVKIIAYRNVPSLSKLKQPIAHLFRTKKEWHKEFPDHAVPQVYQSVDNGKVKKMGDVDFAKQMVVYLQGTAKKARPFSPRAKDIVAVGDNVTVTWCLEELLQGIAPQKTTENTVASIVVLDKTPAKVSFKYTGYTIRKLPKGVAPPPSMPPTSPLKPR